MVLVAVAGFVLIACVLLYNWYTQRRFNTNNNNNSQEASSGKEKEKPYPEPLSEKSGQTASVAVTVTTPAAEETSNSETPKPPKVEVSIPTIIQTDDNKEGTPKMSTPAATPMQSNTAPSSSMPPPRSKSPPRLKPPTFSSGPPRLGGNLRIPPSAASSLRVPVTKVLSNTSMAPSALMPPPQKKSRAVALEPGHSPLDWAALTSNPTNNLRGKDAPTTFVRVTPSQLKAQNGRKGKDTWTVYQGKVYNITPYVPFHPGGKGEILRGAGKDSAKLFNEVHPWVNWDGMLKECMVGIYVSEDEMQKGNELDEMD